MCVCGGGGGGGGGEGGMGNDITYYEVGNTTMEFVVHAPAAFVPCVQ